MLASQDWNPPGFNQNTQPGNLCADDDLPAVYVCLSMFVTEELTCKRG